MPQYVIAGKTIQTEQELTDSQIEEVYEDLTGKVIGSNLPKTNQEDTGIEEQKNFYLNALQQGVGDFLNSLVPDAFKYDYEAYKDVPVENWGELARQQEQQFAQGVQEFVGAEQIASENYLQDLVGKGLRATAAEGPLAFAGAVRQAPATFLTAPAQNIVASTAGVLGQETGRLTGEGLDAPEPVTELLESVGGAVFGVGSTAPTQIATGLARKGVDTASQFKASRGELKDSTEKASQNLDNAIDNLATNEIQQIINKANIVDKIGTDEAIQKGAELSAKMEGLDIVPFISLIDNPIYHKNIERLYRTHPEFRQQATKVYEANLSVLEARLEKRYGTVQAAEKAIIDLNKSVKTSSEAFTRAATKKIDSINKQIEATSQRLATTADTVSVGAKIDSLLEAKKAAVRARLAPQYEKVLIEATNRGIRMRSNAVEGVYNYVVNTGNVEKFQAMPSLYNKIEKFWKPVADKTRPKARKRSPDVSVREVDSLKREINKQLRTVKDVQKLDLLRELKQQLNTAIEAMPPTFSQRYKAVDNKYYQELGMPLNTEGVKQLDSTKFLDQAGRLLIKPEQAADFLGMVGKKGESVVADAVLAQFQSVAFKETGALDLRAANKFMAKHKRTIDLVPALRQQMRDVVSAVKASEDTIARIDAQHNKKATELADGFYKAFNSGGLKKVAADVINSPKQRKEILDNIKNLEPETAKLALKGVKSAMVELAMGGRTFNGKSLTTMEFVERNKNAFNDVFGPRYVEDLKLSLEALDMVKNADLTDLRQAVDFKEADTLSEKTGVSFTQLQSVLRDRITNAGTKAAILTSKASTSRIADKRDSQLAEFMLNTKGVEQIARKGESLKKPNISSEKFKQEIFSISNILMNSVTRGIYFGTQEAEE